MQNADPFFLRSFREPRRTALPFKPRSGARPPSGYAGGGLREAASPPRMVWDFFGNNLVRNLRVAFQREVEILVFAGNERVAWDMCARLSGAIIRAAAAADRGKRYPRRARAL